MKTADKQRANLNKNKKKKPIVKNKLDKTIVVCPITQRNIYKYVCVNKCDYYQKNKCPDKGEI